MFCQWTVSDNIILLKSLLFLIIIFLSNESISQVDSLDKRLKHEGEVSLGGAYQTGNLNLFIIKGTIETNINYKKISSNTYLQYAYNKTFTKTIQNDFFGFEEISLNKKKKLYPQIVGMYEKSKVKSVDNHYYFGFGLAWNILSKEKFKLSITNAIAFEKKDFLIDKLLNYEGVRYSMIMKGNYAFLKNKLILNHKFFLNPLLFNSKSNFRFRLLVDLLFPLSKKISSKLTFDYSHENIVDSGYKPENFVTTFGLSLKL